MLLKLISAGGRSSYMHWLIGKVACVWEGKLCIGKNNPKVQDQAWNSQKLAWNSHETRRNSHETRRKWCLAQNIIVEETWYKEVTGKCYGNVSTFVIVLKNKMISLWTFAFWRTSKYQHGHLFYARKPIDLIIDF